MVILYGFLLASLVVFQGCNKKTIVDTEELVEDVVKIIEDVATNA